ncbi:MAG: hypothetical protein QXG70_04490, partial [Candidatus Methanomethylicaceae archaeon]
MRIVMKFGGVLMDGAEKIDNSANLVVENIKKGDEVIVVVSAMSNITDELIDMGESAKLGDMKKVRKMLNQIEDIHLETARKLCSGEVLSETESKIKSLIEMLTQCLTG